jgi:hypothetical protein
VIRLLIEEEQREGELYVLTLPDTAKTCTALCAATTRDQCVPVLASHSRPEPLSNIPERVLHGLVITLRPNRPHGIMQSYQFVQKCVGAGIPSTKKRYESRQYMSNKVDNFAVTGISLLRTVTHTQVHLLQTIKHHKKRTEYILKPQTLMLLS